MLISVVGKCPLCNENAEENTAWGNEICLPTKSAYLFCNPDCCLYQILQGWTWSSGLAHHCWFVVTLSSYCFLYQMLSDGESVRWLNHAIKKMWPICMEKIVSQLLKPIIPWFLDKFKPWTVVWFISFYIAFSSSSFSIASLVTWTPTTLAFFFI
jgi:hypothetical protein